MNLFENPEIIKLAVKSLLDKNILHVDALDDNEARISLFFEKEGGQAKGKAILTGWFVKKLKEAMA